jgi:coatomer subunit beta
VEYRQLLIASIHTCAIQFPTVAAEVVHVLMEFLSDTNTASAVDVITFVRYVQTSFNIHMFSEVVERNHGLRKTIVSKLLNTFNDMRSGKVYRGALWIAGEFCRDLECTSLLLFFGGDGSD